MRQIQKRMQQILKKVKEQHKKKNIYGMKKLYKQTIYTYTYLKMKITKMMQKYTNITKIKDRENSGIYAK